MKKLGLLIAVALLLTGSVVYADNVPQGIQPTLSLLDVHGKEVLHWVWTFEVDGATCVFVDGELDCFCPCGEYNGKDYEPPIVETQTPPKPPTEVPPTKEPTKEPTPEPTEECRPGWGYGDKNHCHGGPPGQNKKGGG